MTIFGIYYPEPEGCRIFLEFSAEKSKKYGGKNHDNIRNLLSGA